MRLRITTPLAVVVDVPDAAVVRAEDETGAFGLLEHHADFLTALGPSVVGWKLRDGREGCCAVRGGVLSMEGGERVSVATREAVVGESLEALEKGILSHFRKESEEETGARVGAQRLQLAAIRRIIEYLRPERAAGLTLGGSRRPRGT